MLFRIKALRNTSIGAVQGKRASTSLRKGVRDLQLAIRQVAEDLPYNEHRHRRQSAQQTEIIILPYLMILSARASTLGGIVRPICLAALRLMMNSNLIGCSTGRSAGLAPFKILSTYVAARRKRSRLSTP